MSKILKYRCKSEVFFKDYLPDEFFINLTEQQRISFRELRENYLLLEKSSKEIEKIRKEIKLKYNYIKSLEKKMGDKKIPFSINGRINKAEKVLSPLIQNLRFSISVGLRYYNSKNKKNPKFYLRIKSFNNSYKNIYIGSENNIKKTLKNITNKSFKSYDIDELKPELKLLYSVYTRYFVWKNSWKKFFNSKHSLKEVEIWSKEMGSEMYRW